MRNVNFNPPRAYLLVQKVMKHTPKNGIAEVLSRDVIRVPTEVLSLSETLLIQKLWSESSLLLLM